MTYIGPTNTLPPSARNKIRTTRARDETLPVSEQVLDTSLTEPVRERRRSERRRRHLKPLVDLRSGDRRRRRRIDIEV